MAKRKSGPSGQHASPRRQLCQSKEAFEAQDREAKRMGVTWAEWARAALMSRISVHYHADS